MIEKVKALLGSWFGPSPQAGSGSAYGKQSAATLGSDGGADVVVDAEDNSSSHLVPYDEDLLERSRTQWQFGDWASLMQLTRETLQHHPDRAKLALLAAAGHQVMGNAGDARHLTQLALGWGCSKRLVSQILISGVHNILARAATIDGSPRRALKHFESSIATVNPGTEHRLIARARAREELQRLGISDDAVHDGGVGQMSIAALSVQKDVNQNVIERLEQENAALALQIGRQNEQLVALGKSIENTVKKEMLNATQQLEAFLGVQSYLIRGERLPSMHGWPISPDLALFMLELIDRNDYDLIIEFGSGTSTVLIAKALARNAHRRQGKPRPVQVAFEHLERFHAQTEELLRDAGLVEAVQLVLAPLEPYIAPNGHSYPYYGCHEALQALAACTQTSPGRVLLLVDGPPAATGKHARYPALPAVLATFGTTHIDILLDDYVRDDEKEVVQLWLKDLKDEGIRSHMKAMKMEKDACLIRITR